MTRNILNYIARIFTQIIHRETFKEIQIVLGSNSSEIVDEEGIKKM